MEITNKQRADLLRAHNKLRDIVNYIDDCRDISVSHLRDIEESICVLHQVGNFSPKRDAEGHSKWWANWVYTENSEKQDD